MDIKQLLNDFKQVYEEPEIRNITVGFSSIDPQKKQAGSTGTGSGTNDHEQLNNLWGGDSTGHYHMNGVEWHAVQAIVFQLFDYNTGHISIPASLITGGSNCTCDPDNLTDAQKKIVDDKIDAAIQNLLNSISPLSLTTSDASIVTTSGESATLTLTAEGIDDITLTGTGDGLNITITEVD